MILRKDQKSGNFSTPYWELACLQQMVSLARRLFDGIQHIFRRTVEIPSVYDTPLFQQGSNQPL